MSEQEFIKSEVHIKYEQDSIRINTPLDEVNGCGTVWILQGSPKFQLLIRVNSVIVSLDDVPKVIKKLGQKGIALIKRDESYAIDIDVMSWPPDVNEPADAPTLYQATLYLKKRLNDSDEAAHEAYVA